MNPTVKKIIIALVILVCAGFIFIPRFFNKDEGNTPVAADETTDSRLPVSAIIIKDASLEDNLRITGSLIANEAIMLNAEVSGIIEKIYFKEGEKIKKGQLLVQLDNEEIAAEIEKLEYTLKLNEDMEYRQKQLLEKEAISKEEYETALTTLNTIKADLRLKKVQLSKRQIRAPYNGIIGLRKISEGSYVTPSEDIASFYNIDPIKIDFAVPGKYAAEVNVNDKIQFTVDAFNTVFTGRIYAIEPQIDPQTRTLQVRALSENDEGKLLPGQFASIELTLETYDDALMVPTEAVIPELSGKKVYVYQNGVAETKDVETGIRTADEIQIISGLKPGDTLITSGMLQLQPGTSVKLTF